MSKRINELIISMGLSEELAALEACDDLKSKIRHQEIIKKLRRIDKIKNPPKPKKEAKPAKRKKRKLTKSQKRWLKKKRKKERQSQTKKRQKQERAKEYKRKLRQDYQNYIHSNEWKDLRKLILERDRYECVECGAKSDLHVHHLHYKNFKKEKLDDLVTLCQRCHMRVHDKNDDFRIMKNNYSS